MILVMSSALMPRSSMSCLSSSSTRRRCIELTVFEMIEVSEMMRITTQPITTSARTNHWLLLKSNVGAGIGADWIWAMAIICEFSDLATNDASGLGLTHRTARPYDAL